MPPACDRQTVLSWPTSCAPTRTALRWASARNAHPLRSCMSRRNFRGRHSCAQPWPAKRRRIACCACDGAQPARGCWPARRGSLTFAREVQMNRCRVWQGTRGASLSFSRADTQVGSYSAVREVWISELVETKRPTVGCKCVYPFLFFYMMKSSKNGILLI